MDQATRHVVIDDGTKEIVLENNFGQQICKVHFRPADFSILDRLKTLQADFASIVEPLKSMDIKNDGTATTDADWDKVKAVEDELKKRINALFDMDDADQIFATRNAFSSVGGKFFVQHVLDGLAGVIEQTMAEELKASAQKVKKYLKPLPKKSPAKKAAPAKKPASKKKGAK